MRLNTDHCYKAVLSRDARFDGVFYIAVASTKIYCRTICRVKTPLKKNCTFYPTAAEAEAAGYRPCLRCRPELAPGHSSMDAVSRLAQLAMQRIEAGALCGASIADLADEFGVSDRHLRRVMQNELGVSPVEIAQTQRLHLAKRLLTDTALPITDVAYASGFASLRRFNALFKERYRLEPRRFRQTAGEAQQQSDVFLCTLSYRPPLAWRDLLQFLRARAVTGVEVVTDAAYQRTISLGKYRGTATVTQVAARNQLCVAISASLIPVLVPVLARLKRVFDLDAEPLLIAAQLGTIAEANTGLRVPGAFDGFEIAVRAILGQQVSVQAASTLSGRFAAKFGEAIATEAVGLTHLHPTAERIARASVADIASLGIITQRAQAIIALAQAVVSGKISLEPAIDVDGQIAALTQLPGIGAWTAQYIAMRTLSWPDAFPHTDLVVMKRLGTRKAKEVLRIAEAWRPWRSYATMHLWKSASDSGTFAAPVAGGKTRRKK